MRIHIIGLNRRESAIVRSAIESSRIFKKLTWKAPGPLQDFISIDRDPTAPRLIVINAKSVDKYRIGRVQVPGIKKRINVMYVVGLS